MAKKRDIKKNTAIPNQLQDSEFYRLYSEAKGYGSRLQPGSIPEDSWVIDKEGQLEVSSKKPKKPATFYTKEEMLSKFPELYQPEGKYKTGLQTGTNRIYTDVSEDYPTVPSSGENHWNVKRFAYAPFFGKTETEGVHYNTGTVTPEGYASPTGNMPLQVSSNKENKLRLLEDMYKYNLSLNSNKKEAWKDSKKFIRQEINPLINTKYHKLHNEGFDLGRPDENRNKDSQWFNQLENLDRTDRYKMKALSQYNRKFRNQGFLESRDNSKENYQEYLNQGIQNKEHGGKINSQEMKNKRLYNPNQPLDLTRKFSRDIEYEDTGRKQEGGTINSILPYHTFTEYDRSVKQYGGKAIAQGGYPNNLPLNNNMQYNYWNGIAQGDEQESMYGEDFRFGQQMSQENSPTPPIGVPDFKYQRPLMNSGILGQSANNPDFKNQTALFNSGVKGQSAGSKNSIKNLRGKEAAGLVPEGTTASTISSGVNSGMNMLSTAMSAVAPPDSKFGKAMNKGNAFAEAAAPLGMLDMVVPGLGTGLVQGARLAGAITGGVQAKNEEVDVNRMKDINKFNAKYNNQNYDNLSQGNYLAEEGFNLSEENQDINSEELINSIFQDFDMFLNSSQSSEGNFMQQGGTTNPIIVPPTRADSLNLYNNNNNVLNFYKNSPDYIETDGKYPDEREFDNKRLMEILQAQLKYYKNDKTPNGIADYNHTLDRINTLKTGAKENIHLKNKSAAINLDGWGEEHVIIKDGIPVVRNVAPEEYRKDIDENQYYQRETLHGALNMDAPMQLFDNRINPTSTSFFKYKHENISQDRATIHSYNPILIKPYDMLTEEEKVKRIELLKLEEKSNNPPLPPPIIPRKKEASVQLDKKGLSPIPTNSSMSNIQLKQGTPVQDRPKGNFLITTKDKPMRFQRKEDYNEILGILKQQGLTPKSKSELANGKEASANFAGTYDTLMKWMEGKYQGTPAYEYGGQIITDPQGQYKYPGQITRIPSNSITMKGVNYPILGISDKGDTQLMMPNQDYMFDGNYVTEYPLNKSKKKLKSSKKK